jgi:transposase
MTKVKSVLAYEGIKPPKQYGLFTKQGIAWLHTLNIDPIECYLTIIATLNDLIRNLSLELKKMAKDDEDVKLLMTIPGVGYYTALLIKAEVGDVSMFSTGEQLCKHSSLYPF